MLVKNILYWIQEQIDQIEADERYKDRPASIFSNAPLAMIQTELKVRRQTLIETREKLMEQNS